MALLAADPSAATAAEDAPPPVSSPALAAAAPALAATPDVVLIGYPVSGRSPRSIRESINESRPSTDGGRFDARADYRYGFQAQGGVNGECDPATVEVTVGHTVTLPELTTRDRLARREREAWDRYFAALVGHEHNHVRIAAAGAEQLRTFMRQAPTCASMLAARDQILAAVREAQAAYDRDTQHGRSEGATYP